MSTTTKTTPKTTPGSDAGKATPVATFGGIIDTLKTNQEARTFPGEIPVSGLYTAGVAGERFLRALRDDGKLLASKTTKGELMLPPRIFDERTLERTGDWVEVKPRGKIAAVTAVHVDLDGRRLAQPQLVAFITFDGVTGGLVHRLGGLKDGAQPKIGLEVEAVFEPKASRKGSLLDIRHFAPVA
jgi:uncharacterized protein